MLLPLLLMENSSSVSSCNNDRGCRLLMLLLLLLKLVGFVDWLRERQHLKNYRVSVIKNVISALLRPLAAHRTLALIAFVEESYGLASAAAAACPSSASSCGRAVVGGRGLIGIFAVAVALRDDGTLSSVRGGAKQPSRSSLARRRTPREANY